MFASPSLKAVICISQMVRDDVQRHFALPDERLHVIYNAVDPRAVQPGGAGASRRDARAPRPSRRARRVPAGRLGLCAQGRGDGDPRARAAAAQRAPRRRRQGQGAGALPAPRAGARAWPTASSSPGRRWTRAPFLGAADAFVLPTLYDPLSNAVLEALACGLPVVTSRRCGAGELVVAHDAGWTCDATDDAAFAERMGALLDAGERARRATRAVAAVAAAHRREHDPPHARPVRRAARAPGTRRAIIGTAARCRRRAPCPLPRTSRRRSNRHRHATTSMCGITGYLSDDPRARAALPAMTAALAHRGPDADGFHFDGPVGFGHRRLTVIDLEGSRQPLVSADGAHRRRLQRRDLQLPRAAARARGRRAACSRTQGDGEVLIHGWRAWGRAAARPHRRHVRVRAVGPRPARALPRPRPPRRQAALLRVARGRARLRLGAEGAAAVSRDCRARSTSTRWRSTSNASTSRRRTASTGAVRKLPAGHWLSVRDGAARDRRVLAAVVRAEARARPSARRSTRSTRELARSVESMLVADVPLGAFVSGGVDSGVVAAMATRIVRPRARHLQPRLHRPRRRQRARGGGARRAAHRQPPPLPDARARRRAARARSLGRRVRRALRRPGGAADDAARRVRAARGDRRADRRRRRRGVRRLLQLREAPARGAHHRACSARAARRCPWLFAAPAAAARARPHPQGGGRAARAPLRDDPEHLRRAAARASTSPTRSAPAATRAHRRSRRGASTTNAIRRRTSTTCSTSTRGCGCPTTCSPRSTARRWRSRSKRACPTSITTFYGWCARLDPALKVRGDARKVLLKELAERYLPRDIVHRAEAGLHDAARALARARAASPTSPRRSGRRACSGAGSSAPRRSRGSLAEHASGRKNHAMRLWVLLILERWFARYEPDFAL